MPLLWPFSAGRRRLARAVVARIGTERYWLIMTSTTYIRFAQLGGKKMEACTTGRPSTRRGRAYWGGRSLACVLLCVLPLSPVSAQVIHTLEEDGRRVFVNDGTAAVKPAIHTTTDNSPALEYWSNTERRWKPLPSASSSLLKRARVAAAEVQRLAKPAPEEPSAVAMTSPHQTRGHGSAEIDRIIEEAAARHHVDANLVRAVIKVESNFNPAAVSRKGAMGLMQLMPATARKFNVSNPFDPRQNVDAGVRHLKRLLDNFGGDVGLTLAAYNAGEAAVNRNNGVPPFPETRQYLRQIKGLYGGKTSILISSAPIHVSRDAFGVLTITNVE